MLSFPKVLLAALVVAGPCFSTPLPRPQLYPSPDNEPEPAVVSKRQGDLDSQGTFGLNVFTAPLGGVYAGVGSVNPYSYGLGSIGTAYGVNQLNSGGLGGIPGGFGAAGGFNGGLGGIGGYNGALGGIGGYNGALGGIGGYNGGLGGIGGYNGGLGGIGGYNGALGGIGGYNGGLGGIGGYNGALGGIGGYNGGLGGIGGYPGGIGGLNGGYLGGLSGDSHSERIRRKLIKTLEKIRRRTGQGGQIGLPQSPFTPYGGQFGGLGLGQQLGGFGGGGLVG